MKNTNDSPTGIGLGLRHDFARPLIERAPTSLAFVEIHPENYMQRGGSFLANLEAARNTWPVLTHGLSLCYGAIEPFDRQFLGGLRDFLRTVEAPWHSDHMCAGGAHGSFFHDLIPLPFTDEVVDIVSARFIEARDMLDTELAFENVSYYAPQSADGLDEAHFVNEVLARTDGKLLLDVNNVVVNANNFGFDPYAYIDTLDLGRVVQLHVAGHFVRPDGLCIDTHAETVPAQVFELLEYTLRKSGARPVLLERDDNYPTLDELLDEVDALWEVYNRATDAHRAAATP